MHPGEFLQEIYLQVLRRQPKIILVNGRFYEMLHVKASSYQLHVEASTSYLNKLMKARTRMDMNLKIYLEPFVKVSKTLPLVTATF